MARNAVLQRGVSIALACRTFGVSETCYRYRPEQNEENQEIADWLERLTSTHRTWGFGLCFLFPDLRVSLRPVEAGQRCIVEIHSFNRSRVKAAFLDEVCGEGERS